MKITRLGALFNCRSMVFLILSVLCAQLPFMYPEWVEIISAKSFRYSYSVNPQAIYPTHEALVNEQEITLEASPFPYAGDNRHIETVWKVRRADKGYGHPSYDESFNQTTIPAGPKVNEKLPIVGLKNGFKYAWQVEYIGTRATFKSPEFVFKVGKNEPHSLTIPPGVSEADFRMISFVRWPSVAASTGLFGEDIGQKYDTRYFRIGTYNPELENGSYVEFGNQLNFEPGHAYWFFARNGFESSFQGVKVSLLEDIEVQLYFNESVDNNGWNMIGCPNDVNYDWNMIKVKQYDTNGTSTLIEPILISNEANDLVDQKLWRWESGSYQSGTTTLEPTHGYWVRALKPNTALIFSTGAQIPANQVLLVQTLNQVEKLLPNNAYAYSGDTPPPPIASFSLKNDDEPADAGCFIKTVKP